MTARNPHPHPTPADDGGADRRSPAATAEMAGTSRTMAFLPLARRQREADDGPVPTTRRPRWIDRGPAPIDVFHLSAVTGRSLVAPTPTDRRRP